METKAIAKDTGVSARKMRLMVDMVRGKKIDEALAILRFAPSPAAKIIAKAVKSAAANAENNYQMTPSDLKIVRIFADDARRLKRFQPRARGRADRIVKRSSHITVIVSDTEG